MYHAYARFAPGLHLALCASAPPFILLHSPQRVHHKPSEYNLPPAPPSGWSGGTLVPPWTCPIPIEPPRTPVFDQPSLSRPLSCGISAAGRFRCGADLWLAGARSLRLCGPRSAKLDPRAACPARRFLSNTSWSVPLVRLWILEDGCMEGSTSELKGPLNQGTGASTTRRPRAELA